MQQTKLIATDPPLSSSTWPVDSKPVLAPAPASIRHPAEFAKSAGIARASCPSQTGRGDRSLLTCTPEISSWYANRRGNSRSLS